MGKDAESVSLRKIAINPGHRQKFWHRNCVAVGMAAGFLEPLEASALVLVELSAEMISEQLPATRETMDIVAKRFNEKFRYRWDRVIDFLKLHYVLTERRDSDFWMDNRDAVVPDSLQEVLALWRHPGTLILLRWMKCFRRQAISTCCTGWVRDRPGPAHVARPDVKPTSCSRKTRRSNCWQDCRLIGN